MKRIESLDKMELVKILEVQQAKRKSVITPTGILKNMGFPIMDHSFFIQNKSLLLHIRTILKELEEEGVLAKRNSKQDFLGIKEVGYNYL